MALTFWIEAINSGGAKEHKQKAPCIFCQYYPCLRGVFLEQYSPSTSNLEVIYPPLCCQFYEKYGLLYPTEQNSNTNINE